MDHRTSTSDASGPCCHAKTGETQSVPSFRVMGEARPCLEWRGDPALGHWTAQQRPSPEELVGLFSLELNNTCGADGRRRVPPARSADTGRFPVGSVDPAGPV